METIRKIAKIDTTNKLTIANDVSMDKINYYSELKGKVSGRYSREQVAIQDEYKNTPNEITKTLKELEEYALNNGFTGIHVVCEPTGVYSNLLLQIAHDLGHSTAYVNGEVVHKAKVIENNDAGKDDIKDPRIIFMLSKMGKEQIHRVLSSEYKMLRDLNKLYDNAEEMGIRVKCQIHPVLKQLFGNFPMEKNFKYSPSGYALHKEYGFNPWRIVKDSYLKFSSKMRARLAKTKNIIRDKSLKKIYSAAIEFTVHYVSEDELTILEQHYTFLLEDYTTAIKRKFNIQKRIEQIYDKLLLAEDIIPVANEDISSFQLGRILGETGPLSDFDSTNELLKFAGLNLRKRESGKFKGKLKLSKKGRAPLRKVLGTFIFGSVKKGRMFSEYYHVRKKNDKLSGAKLFAILERKLLKFIFGMAKNKESFNSDKILKCESQYKNVA